MVSSLEESHSRMRCTAEVISDTISFMFPKSANSRGNDIQNDGRTSHKNNGRVGIKLPTCQEAQLCILFLHVHSGTVGHIHTILI